MNAQESSQRAHVPVLIVGGSMVGISAALLLQFHGVDFVLVDKLDGLSVLPRSRGVHKRTTEMYRQIGVEDLLVQAALASKKGGLSIRIGDTVLTSDPFEVAPRGYRGDEFSPSQFLFLPQTELEPILLEVARERGGDLRFHTELADLSADTDGVTATLVGPDGATTLSADYLIVVDGTNGPVREAFGITGWERPASQHYIDVEFRADLAEILAEHGFGQCLLTGDTVRGLIASTSITHEWSLNIEYDPTRETLADYPVERCVELVRAAIGAADFDVEVLVRESWDTGAFVADEYRRDRIFRAGDAAHRRPPWGGYTPNVGVAEVHNLAWKLATVLAGRAGDGLLDTYQDERRTRAVFAAEQAMVMNDFHARFGVETPENKESLASLIGMEPTMSRFRYGAAEPHVENLTGQTGTRVPHVWLTVDGRRLSTLDLCGPGFTVLTDTDLADWRTAAADVQTAIGLDIAVRNVDTTVTETTEDTVDAWRTEADLPNGGALLIRPDQHVLARSDEELSPATLLDIMKRAVA
jgi:putative polyketide hydroxylase